MWVSFPLSGERTHEHTLHPRFISSQNHLLSNSLCIVQIAILIHDLVPRKSTRKLKTIKYKPLYYPSDWSLLCEVSVSCIKECKINNCFNFQSFLERSFWINI